MNVQRLDGKPPDARAAPKEKVPRKGEVMTRVATTMKLSLCALALAASVTAQAQPRVITSFSGNGALVCSNLAPGSVATVEWTASVTGPWTNNWAGLEVVTADSNGMIQVRVPMFYRVRGTDSAAPEMVLIPAGTFTMGATTNVGHEYYGGEVPQHTVSVSAFYMDKYEVTKSLWDKVYQWATNHGYSFNYAGSGKASTHPVQTIDWYDAVKWCNARSEKEGWTPAYYTSAAQADVYRTGQTNVQTDWVNWSSGYRLPTEAEWERAARGGASGHRFPWPDVDTITHTQANYYSFYSYSYDISETRGYHPTFDDGVFPYTSPIGSFGANGYGLYDMAGNVWEWCWDWYSSTYYDSSPGTDPRGPTSGSQRVIRGGSWYNSALDSRTAYRNYLTPDNGFFNFGFRSVLPPGQ